MKSFLSAFCVAALCLGVGVISNTSADDETPDSTPPASGAVLTSDDEEATMTHVDEPAPDKAEFDKAVREFDKRMRTSERR